MRSSKYLLLNDSNWLQQKYIIEGLSTNALAELAGCPTAATICQALRRHKIQVRTKSEGHRSNREEDGFVFNSSVLNGCLLGDACLKRNNKESNDSFPIFQRLPLKNSKCLVE